MRRVFDGKNTGAAQAEDEKNYPLPCSRCGTKTERETLVNYGSLCSPCFRAYCESPPAAPAWMVDKRTEGPKAWAEALLSHHAKGGAVSKTQIEMAKRALNRFGLPTEAEA